MLVATASSWLVPAVTAGSDDESDVPPLSLESDVHDEETCKGNDVGDGSIESEESIVEGDSVDEGNAVEDGEHEYNPMGLQVWVDEESFARALEGGRLVLAIIVAPWCVREHLSLVEINQSAALAAEWLDETFDSIITSSDSGLSSVTKPLIGIMDSSVTDGLEEIFGSITHVPAMKFVLTTFPRGAKGVEEDEGPSENEDGQMQIWNLSGPRETSRDLHDSVLMYWYRYVVSNALSSSIISAEFSNIDEDIQPPIFTFTSQLQLTTFLESHGDRLLLPAQARRRHQSQLEAEVFNFYMGRQTDGESSHIGGVFQPFHFLEEDGTLSRSGCNQSEENDNEDNAGIGQCIQEIDPYILLVQCRSKIDYGNVELDEGGMTMKQIIHSEIQQKAKNDFDDLAEEMSHRRDVAFFALNATSHNDETIDLSRKVCGGLLGGIEGNFNGAVAFLRARRYVTYSLASANEEKHEMENDNIWNQQPERVVHDVKTDWDEVKLLHPQAIFVPSTTEISEQQKDIYGKGASKDPNIPIEYVQSNLVASTVVHATPTVMWFDRDRIAQLAFPWYRKIHAVLFVDSALAYKTWRPDSLHTFDNIHENHPSWPSCLNHSTETAQLLLNQQKAVQMFYNAALRHRVERPTDDVVFLIVPSSEVGIMNSFGIDIWTPLDEALFSAVNEDQSKAGDDDINQSSNDDSGYCSTSENGESQSTLPALMITDSSGRSGMQSGRYYLCSKDMFSSSPTKFGDGGAIGEFIDHFFRGTMGKPFTRSETSLPKPQTSSAQATNQPNNKMTNVTVLTGNTFESLVMDRNDEHTMLLMTTISCGHCKRFSIFWNELSSLVQALNWSGIINIMKIDVSRNDVPHDKINAWDLPSVYYFPAGEKSDPIEMMPTMNKTNPQNDYDEGLSWITSGYDIVNWMVDQGKLDLELLLDMDSFDK